MKKKICMMILCSLLLNLLSVAPVQAKTKNPVKTYRLKATFFEVEQGKSAKFSLQLLKGKKRVKFSKKTKTEKLSTKFKVSYRDTDNGTFSVSKSGVIKASAKTTADISQAIGEVTVTITLKKKNKKKWKTYQKKMKVSVYVSDGHIPPTPKPTHRPSGFVSDNKPTKIPYFTSESTTRPIVTPKPTERPVRRTPKPTIESTATPRVTPTATPFMPSDEWIDRVPGAYGSNHHILYSWDQLLEDEKVVVEDSTIKKVSIDGLDWIHSLIIPEGITTIDSYSFQDTNFDPDFSDTHGIVKGGEPNYDYSNDPDYYYFEGLKYKDSLILPNSLTTIEDHAFYDCDSIRVLEIPKNVTSIGDYAFYSCWGLLAVKLPEGLKSIGESAFADCINMRACNFPSTVESVGKEAFYNDGLIGQKDWYYSNNELVLHVFGYEDDMDACATLDLTNVKEIGKTAFCGHGASSVKWSKHIKTIPEGCFSGCYGLKTVEIPDGVIGIQVGAFDWISIKRLILPDTIENIGYQSWYKFPEIECNKVLQWESRVKNQGMETEYYDYWIGDPLYRGEANESSE